MDRGAWRATVHRVTKESDTTLRLNNSTLRGYRARLVRNTERGRPGAGGLGGTSEAGALPCACQLFSRTNAGRLRTGFQKLTCLGYHRKLTSWCSQEFPGFVKVDKEFNNKKQTKNPKLGWAQQNRFAGRLSLRSTAPKGLSFGPGGRYRLPCAPAAPWHILRFQTCFPAAQGQTFHSSTPKSQTRALLNMEQNNPVSQYIPLKSQRPQQRKWLVGNTGDALKTSYV